MLINTGDKIIFHPQYGYYDLLTNSVLRLIDIEGEKGRVHFHPEDLIRFIKKCITPIPIEKASPFIQVKKATAEAKASLIFESLKVKEMEAEAALNPSPEMPTRLRARGENLKAYILTPKKIRQLSRPPLKGLSSSGIIAVHRIKEEQERKGDSKPPLIHDVDLAAVVEASIKASSSSSSSSAICSAPQPRHQVQMSNASMQRAQIPADSSPSQSALPAAAENVPRRRLPAMKENDDMLLVRLVETYLPKGTEEWKLVATQFNVTQLVKRDHPQLKKRWEKLLARAKGGKNKFNGAHTLPPLLEMVRNVEMELKKSYNGGEIGDLTISEDDDELDAHLNTDQMNWDGDDESANNQIDLTACSPPIEQQLPLAPQRDLESYQMMGGYLAAPLPTSSPSAPNFNPMFAPYANGRPSNINAMMTSAPTRRIPIKPSSIQPLRASHKRARFDEGVFQFMQQNTQFEHMRMQREMDLMKMERLERMVENLSKKQKDSDS